MTAGTVTKTIESVMYEHPELTTVEDFLDILKAQGIEAGFWKTYLTSKKLGRKLTRRIDPPDEESDRRELAVTFLGMCHDLRHAHQILDNVEKMNQNGSRI